MIFITRNLRIRVARIDAGLTQKDLANRVGVSRQTINAIEQGSFNPTIRLCKDICKVLEKTLDELFGEEDMTMYCTRCQTVYEDDRCPICGSRKSRPVLPEDICFLAEEDSLQADILEDLLKQEGVPFLKKSTVGAGMAMKAGAIFERFRFYVRYEHLNKAKELLEDIRNA